MDKNQLQEKQLALLNATVEYYTADPSRRAMRDDGGCSYMTEDGKRCAVGRLLDEPAAKDLAVAFPVSSVNSDAVWERLPENVREYGQGFLRELQRLHDMPHYWDGKGLTPNGEFTVKNIRETIQTGYYQQDMLI